MSETIFNYSPVSGEDEWYLWGGLILALLSLGSTIYVLARKFSYDYQNRKWLLAMLLFFVFLMAAGTAVFSWMSYERLEPISLYADRLVIGQKALSFKNIKQIKLEQGQDKSMVNPNIVKASYKLLLVEELSGKVYVFSERHYPVQDMMVQLRAAIEEVKRPND